MELDWALTFIVAATALFSGAAALRMRAWRWLGVQLANVAVLAAAWTFARAWVVPIVAPVWILTVIAPSLATTWSERLARAEKLRAAHVLARIAAALHPNAGTRLRVLVSAAQVAEQTNDAATLKPALAKLAAHPAGARLAKLIELRFEMRWQEVRDLVEAEKPGEPIAFVFYLRALGELGLIEALARSAPAISTNAAFQAVEGQALLFLAAFGGDVDATDIVISVHHPSMPEEAKRLWRATARWSAGEDVRAELEALAKSKRPRLAAVAKYRLDARPPALPDTEEFRTGMRELSRVVGTLERSRAPRAYASATLAIALANVYVFFREIPGGTTNGANLYALGSLYTDGVTLASAYRLVTATLLHFGALHLVMNMLGLFVLGKRLEALVGRWRLLAIYVVSGVGANALAVVTTSMFHREPSNVVGASGCVMGIAGALLVRRIVLWRRRKTPMARREITWLVGLLVIQVVFDALTPLVAGSIHLFGAGVGAIAGAAFGPFRPMQSDPTSTPPLRAAFPAAIGIVGLILAIEGLWAREGTTRLDERACLDGALDACQRTCEALYGIEAIRDPNEPIPTPHVHGRRLHDLATTCSLYGRDLAFAHDAGAATEIRAFTLLSATCDAGSLRGCVDVGVMLDDGKYVMRDHRAAIALFADGCEAGMPRACTYLGAARADDGDVEAGRKLLGSSCDAGDPLACTALEHLP
jgi:rhomboid protease GluP